MKVCAICGQRWAGHACQAPTESARIGRKAHGIQRRASVREKPSRQHVTTRTPATDLSTNKAAVADSPRGRTAPVIVPKREGKNDHDAPSRATLSTKPSASKRAVRRLPTGSSTKAAKSQIDRTARLERRIARLEQFIWRHRRGTIALRRAPKRRNVKLEQRKSRDVKSKKAVTREIAKKPAIKAPAKPQRRSTLQAERAKNAEHCLKNVLHSRAAAETIPSKDTPAGPIGKKQAAKAVASDKPKGKLPRRRTSMKSASRPKKASKQVDSQPRLQSVLDRKSDNAIGLEKQARAVALPGEPPVANSEGEKSGPSIAQFVKPTAAVEESSEPTPDLGASETMAPAEDPPAIEAQADKTFSNEKHAETLDKEQGAKETVCDKPKKQGRTSTSRAKRTSNSKRRKRKKSSRRPTSPTTASHLKLANLSADGQVELQGGPDRNSDNAAGIEEQVNKAVLTGELPQSSLRTNSEVEKNTSIVAPSVEASELTPSPEVPNDEAPAEDTTAIEEQADKTLSNDKQAEAPDKEQRNEALAGDKPPEQRRPPTLRAKRALNSKRRKKKSSRRRTGARTVSLVIQVDSLPELRSVLKRNGYKTVEPHANEVRTEPHSRAQQPSTDSEKSAPNADASAEATPVIAEPLKPASNLEGSEDRIQAEDATAVEQQVNKEVLSEEAPQELPQASPEPEECEPRACASAEMTTVAEKPAAPAFDPEAREDNARAENTVELEEHSPQPDAETEYGACGDTEFAEETEVLCKMSEPARDLKEAGDPAAVEDIAAVEEQANTALFTEELPPRPLRGDPGAGECTAHAGAFAETKTAVEESSEPVPDMKTRETEAMVNDTVFEEQAHGEAFIQEPPDDLCNAKLEANPTTKPVSSRETLVSERPVNATEWGWGANREAGVGGQVGGPAGWNQRPKRRVLVIDDDATMRMLLKMGLRSHKYDCLTAENGKAAQAVLQSYRPDLILVDLLMPVMDGLTFIQWLRQTACDSTPVLVFTNVGTPQITQEALASGANAFACKPLHLKELMEVITGLVLH